MEDSGDFLLGFITATVSQGLFKSDGKFYLSFGKLKVHAFDNSELYALTHRKRFNPMSGMINIGMFLVNHT